MPSSVAVTATATDPAQLASLPWRDRRAAVRQAVGLAATDPERSDALLQILVRDEQWQVRKELAEHLVALDEDRLARLAGALASDCNRFVVEAVQRSLDRRRKGAKEDHRRTKAQSEVETMVQHFERRYGTPACRQARRLADRLYDVAVGSTVHELRGLMTPLIDTVTTLQAQLQDDRMDLAWAKRHLPLVKQRMDLVQRVLDDMREFSRATPVTRRPEALSGICHEAVSLAVDWFVANGIDPTPARIAIHADPGTFAEISRHQILVALRNLVKNAVESLLVWRGRNVRPGSIVLRVSKDESGQHAVITVRDSGTGLAAADLEKIRSFEPGRTSKKDYGTGFGLPIAYRKVADHGGSLHIESSPEKGTTVTIRLPLQAQTIKEDLL